MENEPITAVINGDNTDTHSQVNGAADNASHHSSRAGSARSGGSKAASVREATAIDDANERKPSPTVPASPKAVAATNGERQPSATVKSKPQSPVVPIVDTPNVDDNDDMMNQEEDPWKAEAAIVRSDFLMKKIF
jgi:hypothetical protein